MLGSFVLPSLLWAVLSAYLVIAGVVVFETDFRTPRNSPAGHAIICVVALVFAATWPLRVVQRLFQRAR
jgi:hypothetical protein